MKRILAPLLLLIGYVGLQAQEKRYDGIFAIANDINKCYLLSESPVVSFSEDRKSAYLTLNGSATPVLSVPISGENSLQIVYGTYLSPNADDFYADTSSVVNIRVTEDKKLGRKFISGGRIFIVKNNKIYTSDGVLIKE